MLVNALRAVGSHEQMAYSGFWASQYDTIAKQYKNAAMFYAAGTISWTKIADGEDENPKRKITCLFSRRSANVCRRLCLGRQAKI